jgi:hypothetical protein
MNEVKMYIFNNKIDIMLISQTYYTIKDYFKTSSYLIYHTTHTDGTAHSGTIITIKNNVQHHELNSFESKFLQAIAMEVEDWLDFVVVSSVYCPSKHITINEQFEA